MKFVVLLTLVAWYWASTKECAGDISWNRFATSKLYTNTRMVTILDQYITPLYIPKANSLLMARMQCGSACASNKSCQALNFFETEYSYVCEMRPENLCGLDKIRKAFVYQIGSTVWDKPSLGSATSCFEVRFNSTTIANSCKIMRPGCLGIWPNCSNCMTNCTVCYARMETPTCTYWLEGDRASQVPIFGRCGPGSSDTILARRTLLRTFNNSLSTLIQLPFRDMNRLFKLTNHTMLQFWCYNITTSIGYFAIYKNAYIDENGTLMNLTFHNVSTTNVLQSFPAGDILKLNGTAMKPTPFVKVTDDRYSCGSFWLLDTNNATYCPGGGVGMWGANKTDAAKYVTETGMRFPDGMSCEDFSLAYVP